MEWDFSDWLALIGAVTGVMGGLAGGLSLVLHWRRDQREKRKEHREERAADPSYDLRIERSLAPNCWDCRLEVASRQRSKLTLTHLKLVSPSHIEFLVGEARNTRRIRQAEINMVLRYGQHIRPVFTLTTDREISDATPVVFELVTVTHAETEQEKGFKIERTLRP